MLSNNACADSCIVRFKDKNNKLVGAGMLVSNEYVITCAHVVSIANGREINDQTPPSFQDIFIIQFPFCKNYEVTASLIAWGPRVEENIPARDIAVLHLTSSLPDYIKPHHLSIYREKWHEVPFYTWGATQQNQTGDWIGGLLKGRVPDRLIQMEISQGTEMQIEEGFSGGPVWCEKNDEIIGILVQKDNRRRISYMLPAIEIHDVWEKLPIKLEPESLKPAWVHENISIIRENLPYLGDRLKQEEGIRLLMKRHRETKENRPYIGILIGSSEECPHKFMKKFQLDILCRDPFFANENNPVAKDYYINWPTLDDSLPERWNVLMHRFSDELSLSWSGNEECIKNNLINESDRFTIVYFHIPFEKNHLSVRDRQLIQKLLAFFESFRDLRNGHYLFVFLSFFLTQGGKNKPLFKWWKRKRSIDLIRAFWEKYPFQSHGGLYGKMLHPLESIHIDELESYITRYGRQPFIDERRLRNKIVEMYEKANSKRLSMENLSKGIDELLHSETYY
jgi:hypothetical protein